MDLRHLQNLVYLAEELHFGHAAKRAHLSQSAFTRSIQALEQEIGLALFDRNKRVVRITSVGRSTTLRARSLLSEARELEQELERMKTGSIGTVSIGAGPFSSGFLVLPALAELHRQHPGVSTRLEITDGAVGLEYLKSERVDLLISDTRYLQSGSELRVYPLGRFDGGFYCRASHPLAKKRRLDGADLRPFSLAAVKLPPLFIQQMRQALGLKPGDGFAQGFESSSVAALLDMTRKTDMIMMSTPCAVSSALAAGELVALQITGFAREAVLASSYAVVRLPGRTLSPAAEKVCALMIAAAQGLATGPRKAARTKATPARRPRKTP